MKTLLSIILFICLIPFNASALMVGLNLQWGQNINTSYDCSGAALLLWECNSTTVGDTGFSPCGCSDSDTTAVAIGSDEAITTGSCVFNDATADGQDYYTLDGTDLFTPASFTVFVRFEVVSWANSAHLFRVFGSATDGAFVMLTSNNDLKGVYIGDSASEDVLLTGNAVSTGVEYIVRYRGKQGEAGNDHQITLFSTVLAELDDTENDDDLAAFATAPGADDFKVGNNTVNANSHIKIKYIHSYTGYLTTDPVL